MRGTIAEAARDRNGLGLVGRQQELRALVDAIAADGPFVFHLHGVAGIGKSSLLAGFAAAARESGAMVIALDGRTIEPTERGL